MVTWDQATSGFFLRDGFSISVFVFLKERYDRLWVHYIRELELLMSMWQYVGKVHGEITVGISGHLGIVMGVLCTRYLARIQGC